MVLPLPPNVPMPSIVTRAFGSDAVQVSATDSLGQTFVLLADNVTLGSVQAVGPGVDGPCPTDLRLGGGGGTKGEKLISVTGCSSIPFGATPVWP